MSQDKKKDSADKIIKRSIELFGLTPEEISDRNVEWMRKKGYKKAQSYGHESLTSQLSKPVHKKSRLSNIIKRLGIKRSD
jgi:hypothetical protein